MSLVLGIDPSVSSSGYALIDEKYNIQAIGRITTDKKDEETTRLDEIYQRVKQLCEEYRPSVVVMEDQFIGKNAQTGLYLARARGVAMLACYHAGCEVVLYSPSEIKKKMTGKGNASKEWVQQCAIEKFKHNEVIQTLFGEGVKKSGKKKNDDISDALAVAYTHCSLLVERSFAS
jgi:crossover junction endodeoxyribonuclease RuvC